MNKESQQLLEAAKEFDSTGLGRLNKLLIELAEIGLETIKSQENTHTIHDEDELWPPSKVARILGIHTQTINRYRKDNENFPEFQSERGTGKARRYRKSVVMALRKRLSE